MPLFKYVGQEKKTGKKKKGTIEAETLKQAKLKLKNTGLYIISIKKGNASASAEGSGNFWQTLNRKPPKPEDVAIATKQFAILTRSAVTIAEALRAISEQTENKELSAVYLKMRELVSEGKTLSHAHQQFPKLFSPIYYNMIGTAEKSGTLPLVLRRLSDFLYSTIALKRKLIGALTYPAFMFIAAIGVTLFLFVSILPKMMKSLSGMSITLPWYTRLLMSISDFIRAYWIPSITVMSITSILFFLWTRTPKGGFLFDKFLLEAPIIGPLQKKVAIARFAETLSTVLTGGVRIIEALNLSKKVIGNRYVEKAIDDSIESVQQGQKLSQALEKTHVFTPLVLNMVKTGEKTGKMDEMLQNVAEVYNDEVDSQVENTTRAIQPLLIIFIAGIVILVVISVMGPLMEAMQGLKGT